MTQEGEGKMFTLKSSALALACAMLPPVFAQSTFKITDLGVLPGTSSSWAYGINARGQVVGFGAGFHAFLWDNGMTTDLGTLPGGSQFSEAWAVNAQGQVVGNTTDFNRHAFLWQKGVMSDLGTLPGRNESAATGINSRGQVVGNAYDSR